MSNFNASSFGQFGPVRVDKDPAPHGQPAAADVKLFDVGDTLDISDVGTGAGVVLPEGFYNFKVTKAEISDYFHREGGKLPDCTQMVVHMKLLPPTGEIGYSKVNFYFINNRMQLGKLRDFYVSVGILPEGATTMTITADVSGRYGRAKFEVNKYKDRNGNDRTNNRPVYFMPLDPDDPIPGVTMPANTANDKNLPF